MSKPPRTVRVLHLPAGGPPALRDVPDRLDAYKGLLDGAWLEQIALPGPGLGRERGPRTYVLLCDEEGKLHDLPFNRLVPRVSWGEAVVPEAIVGPCFVCRQRGAEFASLTPADVDFLETLLGLEPVAWPAAAGEKE